MHCHGLKDAYDQGISECAQKTSTHVQESSDSVFHKGHAVKQISSHATVS